jgi:hypothetical protein
MSMTPAPQPAPKPKKIKMNSRWRKGAARFSPKTTVEQTRFVKDADGYRRRVSDAPSEARFVERSHEAAGWRNGARVRKV